MGKPPEWNITNKLTCVYIYTNAQSFTLPPISSFLFFFFLLDRRDKQTELMLLIIRTEPRLLKVQLWPNSPKCMN